MVPAPKEHPVPGEGGDHLGMLRPDPLGGVGAWASQGAPTHPGGPEKGQEALRRWASALVPSLAAVVLAFFGAGSRTGVKMPICRCSQAYRSSSVTFSSSAQPVRWSFTADLQV